MPELYYKQEYELENGKKIGIIFIDTCLLVCESFDHHPYFLEMSENKRQLDEALWNRYFMECDPITR